MVRAGAAFGSPDAQTDLRKQAIRRKARRRAALIGVVIAAVVGAFVAMMVILTAPEREAEDARNKAIDAFMAQITKGTNGAIKHEGDESPTWFGYYDNTQHIALTVGTCPNVVGLVAMPNHPKDSDAIGPLKIEMPGKNPKAAKAYPVIRTEDSNWARPLQDSDSGLSHCLAK